MHTKIQPAGNTWEAISDTFCRSSLPSECRMQKPDVELSSCRWLAGQRANQAGQCPWYHFGVGEFTTHFRTYFSGWIESDVHWGYDLDLEPWPSVSALAPH